MRTKLKKNEKIIGIFQKHWITIASAFILFLVFALVTLKVMSIEDKENQLIGKVLLFITLCICLPHLLYRIIARKFDIWVVTNYRIIDEHGIFTHNSKESPLEKINNISYSQSILGRILDYGNIQIQTAAGMGATTNCCVSSPKILIDNAIKFQGESSQSTQQSPELLQDIDNNQNARSETKECPYCAEIIKFKARLCRFCGKDLE